MSARGLLLMVDESAPLRDSVFTSGCWECNKDYATVAPLLYIPTRAALGVSTAAQGRSQARIRHHLWSRFAPLWASLAT